MMLVDTVFLRLISVVYPLIPWETASRANLPSCCIHREEGFVCPSRHEPSFFTPRAVEPLWAYAAGGMLVT